LDPKLREAIQKTPGKMAGAGNTRLNTDTTTTGTKTFGT
jgi:hypothetical protein